jgi:putative ABC transport system ATP-binding protein
MSQYAVECKNVVKSFRDGDNLTPVLRGVDFKVPYGELTFLVGPSGCGKTTLLTIIAGLLSPTEGRVDILDNDLFSLNESEQLEFRKTHLGFVFQQYNLIPALTAAENAALPLLAAKVSREEALSRARESLGNLGLLNKADSYPRSLSGGQQQRVAIARSLVHNPAILICDEPTAALDHSSGTAVLEIIRDIARTPERAVLVVTHDNRIFRYADQIAEMNDGQIVSINEPNSEGHI